MLENETQEQETTEAPVIPSEPVVPPTPAAPSNPPAPPTNDIRAELDALQRRALAELSQKNEELQRQLAEKNKTPRSTPEEDSQLLFKNPRQLIREEMQEIVAPLIEFRNQFAKQSAYDNLKANLRSNPQLFAIYNEIAAHVDQAMQTVEPTMQNLQTVIFSVYGAYKAGLIPNSQPSHIPATTQPQVPPVSTPPHIPPSPPPVPRNTGNVPKVRELTEAEREIARRQGLTPEQYIAYLNAPEDVSGWGGIK